MTIFDRVFNRDRSDGPIVLSTHEAFAAIAITSIAADGNVTDEEANRTALSLATLAAFRNQHLSEMGNVLDRVADLVQQRGATDVLKAVKETLSQSQAESAYFLAADLTLADGTFGNSERQFLQNLKDTLGIPDTTALKIVEVVVIKNRA